MNSKTMLKGNLILLLTAIIWGVSFVPQNVGSAIVGPYAFMGLRSLLGGITLLPVIAVMTNLQKKNGVYKKTTCAQKKTLLTGGLLCGMLLGIASTLQTIGIKQGAGESGFITALYIVFVPILSIFLKKKIPHRVWFAVMLCIVGLYYLCGSFALNANQIYLIVGSLFFAIHILVIDYFSPKVDGVKLSCMQFFVAGLLDSIVMAVIDMPTINEIIRCAPSLAYSGIMSCGVAYTLQIIGQKYTTPTVGSLIMSLESVFAALAGWVLLNDVLSYKQILGCAIIFAGIALVQLPLKLFPRTKRNNA